MAINKRRVQEINAGSMADIAFLLLIFFLVATTMNVDTGLVRILPPMPQDNEQQKDLESKERNTMFVSVNRQDQIAVKTPITGYQLIHITQLKELVKNFVLNPGENPQLPEKEVIDIDLLGAYPVSQGVVSLRNDRGTSYNMYIMVQNELTRAFNEIRDQTANLYFHKGFFELDERERGAVQKAVPLKISESEPHNVGGN